MTEGREKKIFCGSFFFFSLVTLLLGMAFLLLGNFMGYWNFFFFFFFFFKLMIGDGDDGTIMMLRSGKWKKNFFSCSTTNVAHGVFFFEIIIIHTFLFEANVSFFSCMNECSIIFIIVIQLFTFFFSMAFDFRNCRV